MTELQVDQVTASYVAAQAARAGVSPSLWLARHFQDEALRESATSHAAWYTARPGVLEAELFEVQAALDDAHDAGHGQPGAA